MSRSGWQLPSLPASYTLLEVTELTKLRKLTELSELVRVGTGSTAMINTIYSDECVTGPLKGFSAC